LQFHLSYFPCSLRDSVSLWFFKIFQYHWERKGREDKMEISLPLNENEILPVSKKRLSWINADKVELVKLRLQGRTFEEIGNVINRTEHACRSEYGRIRRGETDVIVSLKELPELRKNLPFKK
jgi:hypothetical protein